MLFSEILCLFVLLKASVLQNNKENPSKNQHQHAYLRIFLKKHIGKKGKVIPALGLV